ncbi:MAG: T9SS type A sorting domain-containing protein [candidate division Zixibacteria bacterium]|nr:T9SS type A sorting domain-containing protein [Candidatus Tariuqbacter arcticus]
MKKLIITIIIALLSITAAFGQNIELIATVDGYYTGFREVAGNDQNAFIVTVGTTGMLILDISDKFNPYPVGLLENTGQLHGGLALNGDIVYLSSLWGTMSVVDVSNPAYPRIIGYCQTDSLIDETFYYDGYVYLTCDFSVEIVDVSDPQNPEIVGSIIPLEFWFNSTVVYNDLAYITGYTGMFIYDISDPANPALLGVFPADDVYFIDVSGDYAVIETYMQDSLLVIDVSDPFDPIEVGSFYLGEDEICDHIRAYGDYLYVALGTIGQSLYENGMLILDISDPANPVIAGNFGEGYGYLYFYDNYLYSKSGYTGFKIYEISDPEEPQEMGRYQRLNPKETILKDDFAFVLNNVAGIQVLDVSNIYSPVEVEFYYSPGNAMDFAMNGDLIYLACSEAGLRIIDISDPYNLTEVVSYYYPGIDYDFVELKDNYAITTGDNSLVMLDVSNPDSIFEVNSVTLQTGSSYWGLKLMGDYAVLAIQDSIYIIDISNPSHFNLVGSCQISIDHFSLAVEGSYAYVSDLFPGGLSIINLEDPANPYEEAYILDGIKIEDVEVDGDYCYLACYYNSTFKIYDLSNPANPIEIGSYNTTSTGRGVTIIDTLVFFGTNNDLYIFDCSDYVSVEKIPESYKPVTFELLPPFPNPFNQSTVISYKLQAASYVELVVYDVMGRKVQSLVNGHLSSGKYEVIWDAEGITSGVYFVRLEAGEFRGVRKILLVK